MLAMGNLARELFKGDETSLDFLSSMLSDGKMLEDKFSGTDANDLRKAWETAMYGSLISHIWEVTGITPVILDTGAACTDRGVGVGDYISSKLAEIGKGCVDGKLYYLVNPQGSPKSYDVGQWRNNPYREPTGLSTIADGQWEGLVVQDMIASAVTFSKKYGNRKSPKDHTTDGSFSDTWDELWNVVTSSGRSMVAAPGVIGKFSACSLYSVGS